MNIACSRVILGFFWGVLVYFWRTLAHFGGVLEDCGRVGGGSEAANTKGTRQARASSRRPRPSKRRK